MQRMSWYGKSIAAAFGALLLLAVMIGVSLPSQTVSAQFETATPTPTDPIWLGFSLARAAIEEQFGESLQLVARWDWWQDDWSAPDARHPQRATGFDSCDEDVNIVNARPIYFGWTYQFTSLRGNRYEARVTFDLKNVVVCDEVAQAAQPTAAATSAPAAGLPAAIVGAGATGSFELGGHVAGLDQPAIDAMNQSGMKWVKKQIPTSAGVPKGVEFINDAKAKGFKILLGVVGDKSQLDTNFDQYIQDYAVFVRALAEAGADAIEIWNEPNIDREWPTGKVNGATYTRLLAASFNAIKEVNRNTIVISGAPAPTGFFGAAGCAASGCNDDTFMKQMADAGAGNYMDCLGLHYNEGIVPPTQQSGDPRGEYPTYYFQSMTNRGKQFFSNKPICYTELGYLTMEGLNEAIPASFAWAANVTLRNQSEWLAGAAAAAAQRGDVRLMIIWNINFQASIAGDPMNGYRITNRTGGCPSCATLGAVMKK